MAAVPLLRFKYIVQNCIPALGLRNLFFCCGEFKFLFRLLPIIRWRFFFLSSFAVAAGGDRYSFSRKVAIRNSGESFC